MNTDSGNDDDEEEKAETSTSGVQKNSAMSSSLNNAMERRERKITRSKQLDELERTLRHLRVEQARDEDEFKQVDHLVFPKKCVAKCLCMGCA